MMSESLNQETFRNLLNQIPILIRYKNLIKMFLQIGNIKKEDFKLFNKSNQDKVKWNLTVIMYQTILKVEKILCREIKWKIKR